jgi:predicted GTPase
MAKRTKVLIQGAGGRDFHVFNTVFRDDPGSEVVAITAAQIPNIDDRQYPPVLAGPLYPQGIPIVPESELDRIVRERGVERVVFSYSDVTYDFVEAQAARARAVGAQFAPFDPDATMLEPEKPCVAVCAVRTGCGKSAISRHVAGTLRGMGMRVAVLRHPMPYGNLSDQVVQRFAALSDLDRHHCTIEEMEEYEPHIRAGNVVFAGADYAKILETAEREADVIVWDGGNNDTPFVRPGLFFTVLDPFRAGDEVRYFPSRWNLEHADALVIGKIGEAKPQDVAALRDSAKRHNPKAAVIEARSTIHLADPAAVRGRRVLVIEDGPTVTHGGMGFGAGLLAAQRAGAGSIVDPRPFASGEIAEAFRKYGHLSDVLPALGYGAREIADLEATVDRADCEVVVVGTPVDLTRILKVRKPCVRASYEHQDAGEPSVTTILGEWIAAGGGARTRS